MKYAVFYSHYRSRSPTGGSSAMDGRIDECLRDGSDGGRQAAFRISQTQLDSGLATAPDDDHFFGPQGGVARGNCGLLSRLFDIYGETFDQYLRLLCAARTSWEKYRST